MTETNINNKAFSFVELITILDNEEKKNHESKNRGSIDEVQVIDWSDKLDGNKPFIQRKFLPEISDFRISISIDGINYGFKDSDYIEYYKFIHEVLKCNSFYAKVSVEYLREKVFLWLIEVFKSQRANQNLSNFLSEQLKKDIKVKRFYYPILNLTIEESFYIGDVQFTYMTKQYFDDYWDKVKDNGRITKDSFDSLLRKHQGRVFVVVETFAESKKGEEISFEKACLAADIMKLLSPAVYYPNEACYIDLEKRIPFQSEYLTQDRDEKIGFGITMSANNSPFHFPEKLHLQFRRSFDSMGTLFAVEKNDLDELLINSIKLIAKAIMETDLHLRVSILIMVLESIFLLDEEDFKMEKKSKRRICELMFPSDGKKKQALSDLLTDMYLIRHKMTHKSIRLYIELQKLKELQVNLINSVVNILNNKNKLKNKRTLIEYLDRKIKANA